jgi:hypothetical protein
MTEMRHRTASRTPTNKPGPRTRPQSYFCRFTSIQNQLISGFFKGFQRFSNQKIELPPKVGAERSHLLLAVCEPGPSAMDLQSMHVDHLAAPLFHSSLANFARLWMIALQFNTLS